MSLLQVNVEEVWLQDAQDRAGGDRTLARFGLQEDAFGLGRLVQVGPQKAKGPQGKAALPLLLKTLLAQSTSGETVPALAFTG